LPNTEIVQNFVPEAIINLPANGEFRQVVNLLIDIPIDPMNDTSVASFMGTVFDLQERYGGFFLRPELSDKGFNLLIFWGAPLALETDIVRALNFILDLANQTGLLFKAGITYLTAYAGFMGGSLREDYTAYGWGLSLAARFMKMAAPNEIWVDEDVALRAERYFEVHYKDEIAVKGFKHKQKIYKLVGRKELTRTVYHGDLIGRAQELGDLKRFVRPIFQGEFAGVLVVQGEAGIGKSRLVHAFQLDDLFQKKHANWIVCQTDEILRESLNPFRDWLLKRFNVSVSQSEEDNFENFSARLKEIIDAITISELAAELERTKSVLAAFLGLIQPGSLYEQLDAKERYENTFIALSTLLRAESLQKPIILFIEDIQWLDNDTRAFLPYLVRSILAEPDNKYPISILVTRRVEGDYPQFGELVNLEFMELNRLSLNDLSCLASHILGEGISDSLLDLLDRRTEGNPFFAEQIMRYLSEKNLISKNQDNLFDADLHAEKSLPLDVGAILIARLDSLSQDVRNVVQTASILGREFEVQLLTRMLREDSDLSQKIAHAERAEIWLPMDQIRYIFRHALLREAAYSMQLLTRQQELHALAVSAMEMLYAHDLESHYGELAYHAERASLVGKALYYLPLAGNFAASFYRNNQAVDYFSRAIALTSPENLHEQYEYLLLRGKLYGLIGERKLQLQDLDKLERLSRQIDDNELLAQVWIMRADYAYSISDYQNAFEHSQQALDLSHSTGAKEVASDSYRISSLSLIRQGKLDAAMEQAEEGLQLVRRLGKRIEEGRILNSIGLIALEQKNPASAHKYLEEALHIARETSRRGLETKSLNNLGTSAGLIQGDYIAAREYYKQAYLIARERGDRIMQSATLGNMGWAAGMQGDIKAAHSYHEKALSLSREVGDRYQEANTLCNLSSVAIIQSDAEPALNYARQANKLARAIRERSGEAWSLLYLGYAFLLRHNYEQSRSAFYRAIRVSELAQPNLVPEVVAGLLQVALEVDDLPAVRHETEKIVTQMDMGETFEGSEEPLRIYLACYHGLEKLKDARSDIVLREAARLLDSKLSNLKNKEARRMYVENVPWRRAIQVAWKKAQARSGLG
jgi:predicted ATPase